MGSEISGCYCLRGNRNGDDDLIHGKGAGYDRGPAIRECSVGLGGGHQCRGLRRGGGGSECGTEGNGSNENAGDHRLDG